ncbi:hypothetical protein [Rhizobium sp. SSA_523]|uniref:hypothetical protein n=1 Tax=Rhizobium sp. SSA_523 TaxID=2952477 RepID=UPI0020908E75|nr:hypothetical protein [Rhizobium sp. SSA_523]MCO5734083.1 hypothetical protein [Rhizobium sp. SSA_523]WKC24721.1 hypothetical protein QTJ18_11880 [Rhizobium sp. SSA_523]
MPFPKTLASSLQAPASTVTGPLRPKRSLRGLALLLAIGAALPGCSLSTLMKADRQAEKPAVTEVAQAAEDADPKEPITAAAGEETKPKAGLYVDPMVSAAGKARSGPQDLPLRTPNGAAPPGSFASAASPPQSGASLQAGATGAPAANNLNAVVTQPTGVHAYQNSIFAIANGQGAGGSGAEASYAPVRGINPMAGSVFSSRSTAAPAEPPAGAESGMW